MSSKSASSTSSSSWNLEDRVRALYGVTGGHPPASNNDDNDNSGDTTLQWNYRTALAPMVRASTTPLRVLALQYGADSVYTEELIDRSIGNTLRVDHTLDSTMGTIDYVKDMSQASARVLRKLQDHAPLILRIDPSVERRHLIAQLGTGDATLALQAALHMYRDVDAIDINMGCPKKFSVSGGMGSALLTDGPRASDIIRTLSTHLNPLHVPVSAKIRLLLPRSILPRA
jgi:tRNA-dihydrouridine synthase 2